MNTEQAELLSTLKSRAVSVKDALVAAIQAAGFVVDVKSVNLSGEWPRHLLNITHPSLTDTAFERGIHVELGTPRFGRTADKVEVTYLNNNSRPRQRRFTALKGLEAKLVLTLRDDLASATASKASRDQYHADQQAGDAKRASDLKGMVIPPGMSVNIMTGNGPGAGMYRIQFSHHAMEGDSITTTDLTPVEVQMIADLLNGIQKSRDKFLLAAAMPKEDGRVFYWRHNDWNNAQHVTPQLYTREQAEALLAAVTAKAPHTATVKIVPYTAIGTV